MGPVPVCGCVCFSASQGTSEKYAFFFLWVSLLSSDKVTSLYINFFIGSSWKVSRFPEYDASVEKS